MPLQYGWQTEAITPGENNLSRQTETIDVLRNILPFVLLLGMKMNILWMELDSTQEMSTLQVHLKRE